MSFQKHENTNLTRCRLGASIGASQQTILTEAGFGDIFPTSNFYIKIYAVDSEGRAVKQQIDYVPTRSGDTFQTVVRGADECPASWDATTQGTTSFAYDIATEEVYIEQVFPNAQIQDIQDEIERIVAVELPLKLDIDDYISGALLYAVSSTGTDAYQATFDDIISYAQIDGQLLRVQADVNNTGAATFEVNALGAKSITKRGGDPLTNDDVRANQIMLLVWNNNEDRFELKDTIDQRDSALAESLVDIDTYFLGEDADAGDSVFVEDMVTFASATSVQAIGDVTGNTRVSIPAFGSGTASNTLKLALRKYVSPGVDLSVRIETDNAGEPSGTLFDADAISTVTEASLTTSLVDTTVTLAGSITIPLGEKVHIVLFAGTYGSETINATNYFGVGYKLQDTTTRRYEKYDGANRALVANNSETNTHGVALDTTQATTEKRGFRFEITRPGTITTATKNASATATIGYITDLFGNILSQASFVGNNITFNKKLDIGTYLLLADAAGASYNSRVNGSSTTFPKNGTYCNITGGTNDGGVTISTTGLFTFASISFDANLANNYVYVDSDLFTEKVLSLTDSTYSYKLPTDLPRVLTESKTAGEYAIATTLGLNPNFVGLTALTDYYLSQTPGAISSTPGVYNYYIGSAIDATTLNVGLSNIYYNTLSSTVGQRILYSTLSGSGTNTSSTYYCVQDEYIMAMLFSSANTAGNNVKLQYSLDGTTGRTTLYSHFSSGLTDDTRIEMGFFLKRGVYYRSECVQSSAGTTSFTIMTQNKI